jgi:predicted metalloprotease with PDZ domain
MQKYDYYSENYSELGFVYEGFTTYYGDKLLWQSNVFSDSQFFRCISERLNKHYLNFGKYSQSLLNSSIDTWVDGYANFAPHKKVSIYDEGCIFAMTMDLYLILKTNKHRTLRDVCLKLYDSQVNKNQPYTFEFIMNSILETTKDKKERDIILETLLFPNDYLPLFEKVSSPFGFYIEYEESENWWERYFGFKISEQINSYIVNSILPDSPAYSALSLNDEIIGINNIPAKHLFSNKNKLPDNSIQLTINRFHQIQTVNLKLNNKKTFFQKLHLKVKDKLSSKEKDLFTHYKKLF